MTPEGTLRLFTHIFKDAISPSLFWLLVFLNLLTIPFMLDF